MKKTAILIDGGFLRAKLPQNLPYRQRAQRIVAFAHNCIRSNEEELYRIFYYDCPPYSGGNKGHKHPLGISRQPVHQKNVWYLNEVLELLREEEQFALRCGEISFNGWIANNLAVEEVLKTGRPFTPDDFKPNLQQKGVDLRIGMDIALLAKDRLVDRFVLVTADSDLVPAMKLARREGIQVVLVSLGHGIKPSLREHADFYRQVAP